MSAGNKEEWVKLSNIRLNNANPRKIKKHKLASLVRSLLELPQMLNLRGIVIDDDGTILGGNMRFLAIQEIAAMTDEEIQSQCQPGAEGIWLKVADSKSIPRRWVVKASELSDEQKKRFVLADNVSYGEWDVQTLMSTWSIEDLKAFGPDFNYSYFAENLPDIGEKEEEEKEERASGADIVTVLIDIERQHVKEFLKEIADALKKYDARCFAE